MIVKSICHLKASNVALTKYFPASWDWQITRRRGVSRVNCFTLNLTKRDNLFDLDGLNLAWLFALMPPEISSVPMLDRRQGHSTGSPHWYRSLGQLWWRTGGRGEHRWVVGKCDWTGSPGGSCYCSLTKSAAADWLQTVGGQCSRQRILPSQRGTQFSRTHWRWLADSRTASNSGAAFVELHVEQGVWRYGDYWVVKGIDRAVSRYAVTITVV